MSAPPTLGGEQELPLAELLSGGEWSPPPGFVTVDSGRSALRLVARALPRDRPVLLPDYLCASIVQAFEAEGSATAFYPVSEDLTIPPEALGARVAETGASAVLVIDYFGFPVDVRALPEDVLVVEDRSHDASPAARPVPPGRFAVSSLRKFLPVPDGALCAGLGVAQPPPGNGRVAELAGLARALRYERIAGDGGEELEAAYLALFAEAEELLDRSPEPQAMSALSQAVLSRLDVEAAARRRRANYRTLLAVLPAHVVPLRPELPDDVSPLALPVRVGAQRDAVRRELARRRIFCPVHWLLPRDGAYAAEPARRLSAEILSLPIDQRYGEADMRELAAGVQAALEAAR